MHLHWSIGPGHCRCIPMPMAGLALLAVLVFLVSSLHPTECITITTVYAGKKKFRSFNLGIPFLPTLVKVKPNRLNLSFRNSRYMRPPKFKIEGSLPLKVPTIVMKKPDPYEYENEKVQVININKDIRLGQEYDKPRGKDYYAAAASDQQLEQHGSPPENVPQGEQSPSGAESVPSEEVQMHPMPPPPMLPPFDPMHAPFGMMPPMLPLMSPEQVPLSLEPFASPDTTVSQLPTNYPMNARSHRTRRSLNLNEPYHHHVNKVSKSHPPPPHAFSPPRAEPLVRPMHNPYPPYGFPHMGTMPMYGPFPPPPSAIYAPYQPMHPWPYQQGPMAKQDTAAAEAQQLVLAEPSVRPAPTSVPSNAVQQASEVAAIDETVAQSHDQRSLVPMKINIGEHYNPNMVYMDESIVPNLEDASLLEAAVSSNSNSIEEPVGVESSYRPQYYKNGGGGRQKDTGPDDFRVSFSLSGVHGGKLVPFGTGDNIEYFYKQLKKFEGNNLPVGLPPDQLYKYYRAHTFTNGLRVYRMTPVKVIKAKVFKGLLG